LAVNAVSLAPRDGSVHYRSAVVYALSGAPERSLAALEAALRNGYSASEARDDDDLDSLRSLEGFQSLVGQRPRR